MKIKTLSLILLSVLLLDVTSGVVRAHGSHDHEKKIAGPNGGRVLTECEPHAEFFVTAERKVRITFLDDDNKPIAPAAQVVTVTAGSRSAPTKLAFTRVGDALVSDGALPAGNNFPAVVQIQTSPEAKVVAAKFNVNLSTCTECKLAEYACTCAH
jgi:hypothetical protein